MIHHRFALLGLFLVGSVLVAGCGRDGRSRLTEPSPDIASTGPPSVLIGPKAVLLRTPDCSGNSSFEMSVAFSPDGQTVAAGRVESYFDEGGKYLSSASVVSLYDLAAGRERLTITGEIDENCAVAFSPDGGTLAVGLGRAVKLYDPGSGRERVPVSSDNSFGFLGLAFSSDGHVLAAATMIGDVVSWDMRSGRKLATAQAHTRSLYGVAVSPDGKQVASASDGPIVCHPIGPFGLPPRIFGSVGVGCGPDCGVVLLFDVATGRQTASLKHAWTARSVAFSPDGKLLASGGGGTAKLWDLARNEARTINKAGSALDVYCVSFSPDGQTLAVGVGSREFDGSYGEVRLWDVGHGRVRAILKGDAGKVRSIAINPDGKTLVTGSRRGVTLWEVQPATARGARQWNATAGHL